jgi:hypothetical protein
VGANVVVCLDVVEELAVDEGVVEVENNAVVSTNTNDVALNVVALLAFLDRIVMLVGNGTILRVSEPFATLYIDVPPFGPYINVPGPPGFVIAATAIEPTLLASVAHTLTAGDDCAVAGFVKLNVTTQAVPDVVPPDAAVSTSCPELCVHAPVVPRRLDVDETAKLAELAV